MVEEFSEARSAPPAPADAGRSAMDGGFPKEGVFLDAGLLLPFVRPGSVLCAVSTGAMCA